MKKGRKACTSNSPSMQRSVVNIKDCSKNLSAPWKSGTSNVPRFGSLVSCERKQAMNLCDCKPSPLQNQSPAKESIIGTLPKHFIESAEGSKRTRLLSAWDFCLAGRTDKAALGRRGSHSRSLCVGDWLSLGLHSAFPADVLNFLRRQAYEALLVRASSIALRAYPQAKTPFLQIDFS